ncbi:hypothetical protein [Persephonella sp. KM09-Lau-8]|uniref:hypothetical protein n=1 Tax=Persephonella sp. KM09-Lau-8 TaxID=1158345 RepID=UPI0012DE226A|nr:hypothetical protein [Persephonella sp. KM09-Lau-8]
MPQEAFQEGETLEEIIKKIPIENFKKRNKIVLEIHKNKKLTETLDKINFAQEFLIAVNTIEKIIQQENLTVELFLKIYQEVIGKVLNKPDEELLSEVIAITAKSYPVVPYEIGKAIEKDSYHPLKNILETLKIPNNIKPAIEFFKNIKQVYFTTAGITPEKISKELKPTIERSNVYQKIVRETIQEVEVNDPQIPNGRKNNGRNNK